MMSEPEKITVELSRQEALILFDFLRRCDDEEKYAFADQAEQRVLWNLEAALEPQLTEIFDPSYGIILRSARDAIRDLE